MSEPKTRTLDVPGAVLSYDVREADGGGASDARTLLLIGSPMGASGFVTLAGHFGDRTVVTYDPRGSERSTLLANVRQSTPDEHADDLSRLITAVGTGPVDIFASSGGAVNALALVARHHHQVATLVAHEPPLMQLLPDREPALAASRDIRETYQREGFGPAMAKFIALVMHQGPITPEYLEQPAPNPAEFGLPTEDDGSRDDPLTGLNMVTCTHYEPDLDALRAASTRIVLGVGATSGETLSKRTGVAAAEALGLRPVEFPGDHSGFSGGELGGMVGEPDAFAAKLREVLDARA